MELRRLFYLVLSPPTMRTSITRLPILTNADAHSYLSDFFANYSAVLMRRPLQERQQQASVEQALASAQASGDL